MYLTSVLDGSLEEYDARQACRKEAGHAPWAHLVAPLPPLLPRHHLVVV